MADTGMSATGSVTAPAEDGVFLVGRPPAGEFLGYVKTQTVGGAGLDVRALMDVWRAANDHVKSLERDEAGAADGAVAAPLPKEMTALVNSVLGDPMVQNSFNLVPISVGWVELDRLVVYQKHVNLRYVAELREQLGPSPTADRVFRFALPFDHPVPPVAMGRTAQNQWVLTSPSADFRFLGAELIRPDQVTGVPMTGPAAAVMAVLIGHGSNYLNAIAADNRLVLNNGSHRAYALRDLGHTHAPCLIQHVTRREELELISDEVSREPDRYLTASRPPMLKDYFDPRLRQVLPSLRLVNQVRVSFGVEVTRVPAQ